MLANTAVVLVMVAGITVTTWSTGCDGGDGGDEQRVSGSVEQHLG